MRAFENYGANHFWVRDVVSFHVADASGTDTARGEWAGDMRGVVRPLLQWTTTFVGETGESGMAVRGANI